MKIEKLCKQQFQQKKRSNSLKNALETSYCHAPGINPKITQHCVHIVILASSSLSLRPPLGISQYSTHVLGQHGYDTTGNGNGNLTFYSFLCFCWGAWGCGTAGAVVYVQVMGLNYARKRLLFSFLHPQLRPAHYIVCHDYWILQGKNTNIVSKAWDKKYGFNG